MQAQIKSRGVREEEHEETDLNGQQDACVCGLFDLLSTKVRYFARTRHFSKKEAAF